MNKRHWIISLFCVGSIVGLGWKLDREWRQYAARNGPEAQEVHALSGVPIPVALPAPDYSAIAGQNPFHAERNDLIAEPVQAKVTGPPPLVYGSIIFGSTRAALLATEQSPKAEQVAEGSTFEGYRLVSVLPQSVVLESGAGREEIMFYNALERLHRQAAKTSTNARASSQPSVVTSGGGQVPSPPVVADVAPANPPVEPQGPATSARPAPSEKEWRDTPFGPMLFDKKKPEKP